MITQEYDLNLVPNSVNVVVPVSQFDYEGRTIKFNLYNGDTRFNIPSNASIVVTGRKPDKKVFDYACTFSASSVSFKVKKQMTAVSGDVICELRIKRGNTNLGTLNFILRVENTPYFDEVIISETDLDVINGAEDAAIRAEQAAASISQYSTLQQDDVTIYQSGGSIPVWANIDIPGKSHQAPVVYKRFGVVELHLNFDLVGTSNVLTEIGYLPDRKYYPIIEYNQNLTPNTDFGSPYIKITTEGRIMLGGWGGDYQGIRFVATYLGQN